MRCYNAQSKVATPHLPRLKPLYIPNSASAALYNLDTDPSETKNLGDERPDLVNELKALLEQSKSSGRSRKP